MNSPIRKLSMGILTALVLTASLTSVHAASTTVVENVVVNQKFANASGRVDSDFFFYQVNITNNGKNNDRHDGFDFNANFYLKPSIEGRHLKYVTNAIDHVYYKKDWYGGSRKVCDRLWFGIMKKDNGRFQILG
ncbi:hypothetical protein MX850_04845 [Erysipelothrix sp. Poltava]|nr:hypothetical protein MX850_04845 [Erysipelothrix sp. Poltava]